MKHIILLCVGFLLSCHNANAQVAFYNFETTLDDTLNGHHAKYLLMGSLSDVLPTYASNMSGKHISLNVSEGLKLPQSLSRELDTNTSIEMEFTFNLTDVGDGDGFMYIMTNQPGVNGNGFSIHSRHYFFYEDPDAYEVVFTYADGGYNRGIPDHPGHNETRIAFLNAGDEVTINLILDFKANQWSALVNGVYTSGLFDSAYDINLIKQSITDNEIYIGWTEYQAQEMEYDPSIFTSSATFDKLAFYSPRQAGNANTLIAALKAMTAHVDNSLPLTAAQLKNYLNDIRFNYNGNFLSAETEIFSLISTYENLNEPLFTDRSVLGLSTLSSDKQAIIYLQQAIHDEQFNLDNIEKMAGVKFEVADVFPGMVADDAARVNQAKVEVNGSYKINPAARVAADLDDAKRPTGYYAAPGELVNIHIDETLIDKGLSVMIGAHDSDHSTLTSTNRFVRITKTYPLTTTTTKIANPFGGGIYLKIPEDSELGWFEVTIDGAVKSPYFSSRSDKQTAATRWQAELAAGDVQWVDIESNKYMMTLPLSHVLTLEDPSFLMQQWDNILDGFNYVGGRSEQRARAQYFLIDSRLPSDGYGTGYPQVIGDNAPYGFLGSTTLYPTHVLNSDFYKSGFYITLHEMGHGALHPTINTEVETIVHLNAVYIYNQLFDVTLDDAFKYSSGESHTMNEATIDWMIADNFRNNKRMGCDPTMGANVCDELRYQHRGHAKYIEMADLFGWSSVHEMNKVFYDKWSLSLAEYPVVTSDQVISAAAQATNINIAPLMHFWGLQPSALLASELTLLPESYEILIRLHEYKSLVPGSAKQFQPWYDKNYPKKDPVHYPRYNAALANYDKDNYGLSVQAQIDLIITTYFSDTDEDSMPDIYETANNLDPLNASDAALDADKDGLSNAREYALGTDPNQADSDEDGISDSIDLFALIAIGVLTDTDNDGAPDECNTACVSLGMNADTDDDNDGVLDVDDEFPLIPSISVKRIRHDVDGNGKADILWRNNVSGNNTLWSMNGLSIENNAGINVVGNIAWQMAGRGDFDGDGKSDILWRNNITGQNAIYLMDGSNIVSNLQVNTVNLRWDIKAVGDFDGDGKDDIFWRNTQGDTAIYLMNGNQITSSGNVIKVSSLDWEIIDTGDINADGKDDVMWRNNRSGVNVVWLMDGMTLERRYQLNTVPVSWLLAGLGDVNGDGTADLVWREQRNKGRNVIHLINQAGTIQDSIEINRIRGIDWQIADILDLNGDGKDDIFWRKTSESKTYIYLMDGAVIQNRGASNPVNAAWQNIR